MAEQNPFAKVPPGLRSEKIAKTAKTGGVVLNVFSLIKMIGGGGLIILVLIYFMFKGLPWYIGIPFIAFIVLMVVLQIIRIKRIHSTKL